MIYRYVSFEEETWFSPFSNVIKVFEKAETSEGYLLTD